MNKISLERLVSQIERIPSGWLDETGKRVIFAIRQVIRKISENAIDQALISRLIAEDPYSLDVFRLLLDLSQDVMANELNSRGLRGDFDSLRRKCPRHADEITEALVELGLIEAIEAHRNRKWTLEDILVERYKQTRGRAI